MTCRVDTSPLISGACVVSAYDGHGITGAALRLATGAGGSGAGLLFNDWEVGDDGKEFRALLVTAPSSGALVMNEDGSFSLVGAADGAHSLAYRLFVDGADLGTASASIVIGTVVGDTTPPTLTAATAAATGATTASGSVTTSEAGGMLYLLVTTSSSATVSAVKAGSSQAVASPGTQTVSFTGLTASTTYYAYFVHTDASGNDSAVVATASFTTSAEELPDAPLTNLQMQQLYVWLQELASIHGLIASRPLIVRPSDRAAGPVRQVIQTSGDTVTVTRGA